MGAGDDARPEGLKLEAHRAESGGGVLGEGAVSPPPHQPEGLGERCELPQQGPGRSPGRQRVLAHFSITRWRLLKLKLQP